MSTVRSLLPGVLARRAVVVCVAFGVLLAASAAPALAAAPVIGEESALAGPNSAIIRAKIDPEGQETHCKLQYVTQGEYEASGYAGAVALPCTTKEFEPETGVLPASSEALPVIDEVEGLALSTAYRFRFVATNASGEEVDGPGAQFATFGLEAFEVALLGAKGEPFTQAGGHPYEYDTVIAINHGTDKASPSGDLRDVEVELPVGLVGDPAATPRCGNQEAEDHECSGATQVGTMIVAWGEEGGNEGTEVRPLFNIMPPTGVAAAFSARFNGFVNAFIDAKVRTGGDYGIDAYSLNITSFTDIRRVVVKMWGVPAEAGHDAERSCPVLHAESHEYVTPCSEKGAEVPFLTNPTSCPGQELHETARLDAWQAPSGFATATAVLPVVNGCSKVPFDPGLAVTPETVSADSPTGLKVDLHVPQNEEPEGIATSDLKDATVTFPAGLTVNPSSADGLGACTEQEVGFTGFTELDSQAEPGVQTAQFTPGPAECPAGSKLGTVEVNTPLVEHPLLGALYLATPHQNPFGSLIAVYLTVYDPITGVVVKLPGQVQLDQQTGQVSTTFEQNPQLPFEDLKVNLFGSEKRPAFTTPEMCGSYAASSLLEPWSHRGAAGEAGTPDATPSSESFQVSEAPSGGGACVGSEASAPNAPGFTAGTVSPIAGSYSPFVLHLFREDGSQRFGGLSMTLPPGLTGKVAGLEQCPQGDIEAAQARSHEGEGSLEQAHPSCPSGSEVGVVHVGAGSGAPFYVTGRAYWAGPYEGAPFSLVIVTPALAGPFDLGTVVVRAGLYINPSTAQVTVKSDPFPTILDGIPLDIRSVGVEMTRHEFTLNPTSCNVMSVTGEEKSTAGNVAGLSSRFQAGGCTSLPFHPSFTASTQGKTSKASGASLTVKVNPLPGQANIAKVDVSLPKQLPSWLPTLQKACTEGQFAANPSGCPVASDIGSAVASTPILAHSLVGPAYLVSHGGAAFPDLEIVLQGEGITLVLDGQTQIKNGVTYSKFETVPDEPVSSFELVLPQGPNHVLTTDIPVSAKYTLCGQKLTMPTTITGQNGAVIHQSTKIAVTGCKAVKAKPLTRAQKLKAALKVCRTKDKAKRRQRKACDKAAHKRYGPLSKAGKPRGKK